MNRKHIDGLSGEEEHLALKQLAREAELKRFVQFAVKNNLLSEEEAKSLTVEDMERYFSWSEYKANS